MAWKYNPFTEKLDKDSGITQAEADTRYVNETDYLFRGILAAAPAGPSNGWLYINSGDDKMYIYYGGTWQALHTLTPAALTYLLLETGDKILLETGDKLALEA